ncbi:MAG: glycosyltransferase family 2 protein [Armatimonadota bacterium]|nr:glycosyltransferase family 2 protein [Armatimonadota bacterium]
MKLIVQIPCYNEEGTIARTIEDIPRHIAGVDSVEVLIIDDGSSDRTVERALKAGADHLIGFAQNRGLAAAFNAGLDEAVKLGADVIVNTDGDNQYRGECIPDLVGPIVRGEADVVVGARPIDKIEDFSWLKKRLQRLGSWLVRKVSATDVSDATSGFRAFSRQAAVRLTVVSSFTYTHETLIQAGRSGMAVAEVPVRTNERTRPSRLFKSIPEYIARSLSTIGRIYTLYQPFTFFSIIAALLFCVGAALAGRYAYYYAMGQGGGHVQSVLASGVLVILAMQAFIVGIVADLIAANRKLLQDLLARLRQAQAMERDTPHQAHEEPIRELSRLR